MIPNQLKKINYPKVALKARISNNSYLLIAKVKAIIIYQQLRKNILEHNKIKKEI